MSLLGASGRRVGHIDTPLNDEGREQARVAGQNAKQYNIDTIVCSPLARAHETAKIVAKEIGVPEKEIHINSLLIERDFGKLDGQPYEPDVNLDGIADVESMHEIKERAKLALEWIETLNGINVLVVSHGGLGWAMRSVLQPGVNHTERLQNATIERWV